MRTTKKQGIGAALLLLLPLMPVSAAAGAASTKPFITFADSTCSCYSVSVREFDCRSFLRTANAALRAHKNPKKDRSGLAREIIGRYLDSAGYLNALLDTTSGRQIRIFPGKRTIVSGELIDCMYRTDGDTVIIPEAYSVPRPFDASEINGRVREVCDAFMGSGYPFVKIVTDIEATAHHDSVVLRLYVEPDSLYRFAAPFIRGNFTTRQSVILYDVAIVNNSLFDEGAVVRTLGRLLSRRYISEAAALPPVVVTTNDTEQMPAGRVLVPLIITDRSGMGLDGAVGLEAREDESALLHGNLEFTFLNLFHIGEEAQLSYTGDKDAQQLDAGFSRPWLFGLPIELSLDGGLEIEREKYGYLYGTSGLLYETGLRWHAGFQLTGNSVTENSSGKSASGSFTGIDIILKRDAEPLCDGEFSRQLLIATGSGVSRKERRFNRSHVDFCASWHVPLFYHQAIMLRGFSGHIISNEQRLIASEMYRVGGNATVRGYSEDEYAFRTALYGQIEYLYYFQKRASLYILCDGGIGFSRGIDADRSHVNMLGYGAGIRLPAAVGTLSVEWARNRSDKRSPGRIHVRLQNSISSLLSSSNSSVRK